MMPEKQTLSEPRRSSPGSDDAAIESLERGFVAAFRAKDVDRLMSFCATGDQLFVFDLSTPREHVGHDAFKRDWQRLFAMLEGPVDVDVSERVIITDGGSLAYSHCLSHVRAKKTDGGALDHVARVTHVYKKREDRWLLVHEHVSVPIDMSTGKADFQSRP